MPLSHEHSNKPLNKQLQNSAHGAEFYTLSSNHSHNLTRFKATKAAAFSGRCPCLPAAQGTSILPVPGCSTSESPDCLMPDGRHSAHRRVRFGTPGGGRGEGSGVAPPLSHLGELFWQTPVPNPQEGGEQAPGCCGQRGAEGDTNGLGTSAPPQHLDGSALKLNPAFPRDLSLHPRLLMTGVFLNCLSTGGPMF